MKKSDPFYPHTINCIRKSFGPRPQPCDCGGNEIIEKEKKE